MTSSPPSPTLPAAAPRKPLGPRIAIAVCVVVAVTVGIFVTQWHSREFGVGDCATVEPSILHGATMRRADCPGRGDNLSLVDPVYRVDQVLDGKDARCPGGLSRVTFSNEPEDTTYCLSIAGLG